MFFLDYFVLFNSRVKKAFYPEIPGPKVPGDWSSPQVKPFLKNRIFDTIFRYHGENCHTDNLFQFFNLFISIF